MVVPSFWLALHDPEVYPNPDKFDPDRFGSDDGSSKNAKNFISFGCGPHRCLGKELTITLMTSLIAQASVKLNWEHLKTESSEKITYVVFFTILFLSIV